MPRFSLKQKHVVITGASDGIGRALALECGSVGARVTLSARSQGKLDAVASAIVMAGGAAIAVTADVADRVACQSLVERAIALHGPIDVLVCNAGIGSAAPGAELIDLDIVQRTMDINFMGAVRLTAAALESLRQTRGRIVAVSSLQGLVGFPNASAYSASKHAMQGFYDSLRIDLAGEVTVLVVSPGPVATSIHKTRAREGKTTSGELIARRSMPVARCATLIRAAIEAGSRDLVMTARGKLAARLYPFCPDFVDARIVAATRRFYADKR
jgi:short-subunit dehydrogenase